MLKGPLTATALCALKGLRRDLLPQKSGMNPWRLTGLQKARNNHENQKVKAGTEDSCLNF